MGRAEHGLAAKGGTTMRRRSFSAALLALSFAAAALFAQTKVDVTGKWMFDVQTGAGGGMPTVTMKQDGDKLTGHYSSANLGEADFTGTIKGNELTFGFRVEVQGMPINVTYTGTVENKDSMKGTINLAGVAQGTFTGKRQ
ncbi:MAG: hypothetical protein C5B57_12240 [Blastocatellia bacterium]|nr:MAG: hypothetical protein C5B57_12240 [Blastocatellia bacterium]